MPSSLFDRTKLARERLCLTGRDLSLATLAHYLEFAETMQLGASAEALKNLDTSREVLDQALASGRVIYGVNTWFGALANQPVPESEMQRLQCELIRAHHAGAGQALPLQDVRAAMLLRVNALLNGFSGVREVVLQRYLDLLNFGLIPKVREFGSIGASGDLVPLAAIAGAAVGSSRAFSLYHEGRFQPAPQVLQHFDLPPLALQAKEGLALINGTSVLTALAARNLIMLRQMLNLSLAVNGVFAQAMCADARAYDAFIQQLKPHPGQMWVARQMRFILQGSALLRSTGELEHDFAAGALIQDRYAVRCMPQFLGPIVESLELLAKQTTIEMNAVTDNPLIDPQRQQIFHCGNFLGQHMALAMDQLRIHIALLAKHMEAHIAQVVEPSFSLGLPPSLATSHTGALGLKPLQLLGNSLAPLLEQLAAPLAIHFPVHAEQFNQNINSQGLGAAWQTRNSLVLWRQHLAVSALFAVQAVLLRCQQRALPWQAALSPVAIALVEDVAKHLQVNVTALPESLFSANQAFDQCVERLAMAIEAGQIRAMTALGLDEHYSLKD